MRSTRACSWLGLLSLSIAAACSDGSQGENGGSGGASGSGSGNAGGTGASAATSGGALNLGGTTSTSSGGSGASAGTPEGCQAEFAGVELQPVYLTVAFDVSGSMGKGDEPYHDPDLKWKPVVAALRSFFADPASDGLEASLTFFPADGDEDDRCDAESYQEPDVGMSALPSEAFSEAIAEIDPLESGDWRGGTPTLAAVQGSLEFMSRFSEETPGATQAFVFVTDGYPNGCDDDSIDPVVEAIESAAGRYATYVIGVKNPPDGPDTVSDLNRLAVAGGTVEASFIDTGDPEQTSRDFVAAMQAIREQARSCTASIPVAPGGSAFDPGKVNVNLVQSGRATRVGYDQECEQDRAWRYDDAEDPKSIILCQAFCDDVQADPTLELSVEFGCDTVPVVPE